MDRTPSVRVGIDVGGTFTHAVALASADGTVLGKVRVPTTHRAAEGVALGVAQALRRLLDEGSIRASQIAFVAHSTTQATNALLEGDVARVGVLCLGQGLEGAKARRDTDLGKLDLPSGSVDVPHRYLDRQCEGEGAEERLARELASQGAQVLVAAEAYSVDDPSGELAAMEAGRQVGLLATGTHEVSGLYGLRARTRTSVINGSILPKMMSAVEATDSAVRALGICAPLMIVRSDGGVMTADEVSIRPVRTILSGPAAGVAAAVVHLGIADGVFVEVGGTSTDISVIVDGRARERTATIGGHRLHLRTLDIETISVAGGSMLRASRDGAVEVGPRSAHIAGLPYYCFDPEAQPSEAEWIAPLPGDPAEYIVLRSGDARWAFTVTCAQRTLDGHCPPVGAEAAAKLLGTSGEALCRSMLRAAGQRVAEVVRRVAEEANLSGARLRLIGGGGGCDAVLPAASEALNVSWQRCEDADVISAIGVARAVLRESVSRNIAAPTEDDLAALRAEVLAALVRMGAAAERVEVQVELDAAAGIATATGTAPANLETVPVDARTSEDVEASARRAMGLANEAPLDLLCEVGDLRVYQSRVKRAGIGGLLGGRREPVAVVDGCGRVRLQREHATVVVADREGTSQALRGLVEYGDHGARVPPTVVVLAGRLLDLGGVPDVEAAEALVRAELAGYPAAMPVAFVRGDR